jgi:hypothetical protein
MPDSNETTVYKEALYQQMFSHRCVPHVFGINNTKKPIFFIYGVCWKGPSIIDNTQTVV